MAEGTPQELMETHNTLTLEEAVLKYCLKENSIMENEEVVLQETPTENPRNTWTKEWESTGTQTSFLNRIHALTVKNFITMQRTVGLLVFVLLSPAMIASMYSSVIGSDPNHINIGIINEESGNCRSELPGQVYPMLTCDPDSLTCSFLDQFDTDSSFILVFCSLTQNFTLY